MNKKRMVAVMAAAAMMLNVTPVMASVVTPSTVSQSSTEVTGSGTINSYDKTPVFKVTLPTANALDFTVDPYGLLEIASGKSVNVDALANSGAVVSASGAAAVIKNESSVPVTVGVKLTGVGNDVVFKDKGSEVATGTAANMFLALIPSSDKAASASEYKASSYALPATGSESTTKFKLSNANYAVVNNGGSYKMELVSGASNYDATTFKVGGLANPAADWSKVASGSGVSLKAVFEYAESTDADVIDESKGVYGLVSGSSTTITDDMGSVGGAYTAKYVEGQDIVFTGLANADALKVVYLNGEECEKPMAAGQFTYNKTEGILTLPSAFLKGPKDNGLNTCVKFKLIFPASENREDVIITINY